MRAIILALCVLALPAWAGDLPDPQLTPGALDASVVDRALTLADVCGTSTKARRHVTQADKDATFAAYGLHQEHRPDCTGPSHACWEIDHLCSLELGCNNVAANRWPEPYDGQWGAHTKDRYENFLHREACAGRISLEDAQAEISTDWIAGYQKRLGDPQVLPVSQ